MEDLLQQYKDKRPEIVFEWYDSETGAEGWIVINSLRGGAAGRVGREIGKQILRGVLGSILGGRR